VAVGRLRNIWASDREAAAVVVLEWFEVLESRHVDLNMPCIRRNGTSEKPELALIPAKVREHCVSKSLLLSAC
jgi:hypothetical protein